MVKAIIMAREPNHTNINAGAMQGATMPILMDNARQPVAQPEKGTAGVEVDRPPSALADLVVQYQVCWEVWPEQIIWRGERRQIGFALELSGAHESANHQPHLGCVQCGRVFWALRRIAKDILPKERRPSGYDIGPYDQALRCSTVRGNRPEITLTIRILHREGFERPVDACEVRCLEEMKQRLRELGACEQRWTRPKESRR